MSMGYGASCRLISKDEEWFAYEYTSYNMDLENYKEARKNYDGIILINKDFFPQPTIIKKRKRKPNGKKEWIEKRSIQRLIVGSFIKWGK